MNWDLLDFDELKFFYTYEIRKPKAIDVFHPLKKMYEREKNTTQEKGMECRQSIEKAYNLSEKKKDLI